MTDTIGKNPFLHLKTRSLLLWLVAGLIPLGAWMPHEVVLGYGAYGLMLLWMGWQFHRLRISPGRMVGTLSRDSIWIPAMALVVPLIVLFSSGSWMLLIGLLWMVSPGAAQAVQEVADDGARSLTWSLAVLVAPVVEELLFRGVILHRWSARWGLRRAVFYSSLAFGLMHANFLGLFVFGCVMAVLYIRSGTLIVPILCHALNNLIGTVLLDASMEQEWSLSALLLTPAGLTLVSGGGLLLFLRKNWPRADEGAPYFGRGGTLDENDESAVDLPGDVQDDAASRGGGEDEPGSVDH